MWWGLVGEVCPHQSPHRECCAFLGWYKWCANLETSPSWLSLLETHWCALGGGQCGTLWSRCLRLFCQHLERNCCLDSSLLDAPAPFCMMTHCRWWGPPLQCHPQTWWCGLYCVWQYIRESSGWTTALWGSNAQYDGAGPVMAYSKCLRSASKEIQI